MTSNATFDLKGSLIVGEDDAPASPADVTPSPAIRVLPPTFILDAGSQPLTLDDDCFIGYDEKGTATIESTLDANHWNVTLGNQKTGNGQLTVDGGGAKLNKLSLPRGRRRHRDSAHRKRWSGVCVHFVGWL